MFLTAASQPRDEGLGQLARRAAGDSARARSHTLTQWRAARPWTAPHVGYDGQRDPAQGWRAGLEPGALVRGGARGGRPSVPTAASCSVSSHC